MADRPHQSYDEFMKRNLLPNEDTTETRATTRSSGITASATPACTRSAGRMASKAAYARAGITDPLPEISFVELHDAYTSSEIQTYEDMGLVPLRRGRAVRRIGCAVHAEPGLWARVWQGRRTMDEASAPRHPRTTHWRVGACPVNPSGGLIACGHPVGATGLMQGVFALWQLQGTIGKHFGDDRLQIKNPPPRRHPQPRRDGDVRDGQHSGSGRCRGRSLHLPPGNRKGSAPTKGSTHGRATLPDPHP